MHPIIYDGVFTSKPVVLGLGISEALTVGIQFEHLAEEGTEVTPIFMRMRDLHKKKLIYF